MRDLLDRSASRATGPTAAARRGLDPSLLIWATAEGFGGPYTSGVSDIGTAIIYAVVFAGLLALSYYCGTARYSVDYYLEQRVSWWWRLAELRRPARPA